jgi:hypothetical protein
VHTCRRTRVLVVLKLLGHLARAGRGVALGSHRLPVQAEGLDVVLACNNTGGTVSTYIKQFSDVRESTSG